MPEPIHVLVRAARRAVELQAGREPAAYIAGAPTVLRGAATHTGAYLLQALEEQGWTLTPKAPSDEMVERASRAIYDLTMGRPIPGRLNGLDLLHIGTGTLAETALRAALDARSDESQDLSRDLANVNEAYRLEREKNARLRAAHEHGLEMFQDMQSQRDLEYDRAERLRAELRTVTYERDCWKADSGRLRSELQRQAASRDGEQPEPITDEMTMFRAMGLHSQMGGDPIGLGGLRHTREYAERDARAALADGWSEAWIEGATWRRIDVEGGEQHG